MWVLVFFDLPTDTRKHRKAYATFRKGLMQDGFTMIQFSIYARHCASAQNATVHAQRVKNMLPSSFMQLHPDCGMFLDPPSAALLTGKYA